MAQVINTNVMSLNSQRHLTKTGSSMSTALERLSSGLRINAAMDDAAGLAVATKMEAQIRGLTVAMRNASDGISYAQTADTALDVATNQLLRMRDLATQSLNGTISDTERSMIDKEFAALQTESTRIQKAAMINGQSVFATFNFQVGPNNESVDSISGAFNSVGISGMSVETSGAASAALSSITSLIGSISTNRAEIGAMQSRLTFTLEYLEGARENQTAAKSRIMDADFASETANLTRAQILQQAGIAMVAQANQLPQNVLSLLQ